MSKKHMTRQETVDDLVLQINRLIGTLEYTLDDRATGMRSAREVLGEEVETFDQSRIRKLNPYRVRVVSNCECSRKPRAYYEAY